MAPVSKNTPKYKRSKNTEKNRIVTHDENNSGNSQNNFVVEFSSPATILSNQQSSSTSVIKETSSSSANRQKNSSSSLDRHTTFLSSSEQTTSSLNSQTSPSNNLRTSTSSSPNLIDFNPSSLAPTGSATDIVINNSDDNFSGKESQVWQYAIRNHDNETAKCKICNKTIMTKNWSTTGLRKHFIQVHKISLTSSASKKEKSNISSSLKKELHTLAINAIIQDSRSFDDLRRPGIMDFLKKAIPGKNINMASFHILVENSWYSNYL